MKKTRDKSSLNICLLVFTFLSVVFNAKAQPDCSSVIFTVNTTSDEPLLGIPNGSLRAAILWANLCPGPNIIQFDLPASEMNADGKFEIILNDTLPSIQDDGTIIDGTSQPDYTLGQIVISSMALQYGLSINGANQTEIYGLHLTGFIQGIQLSNVGDFIIGDVDRGNIIKDYGNNGVLLRLLRVGAVGVIQSNFIGIDPATEDVYFRQEIGIWADGLFRPNQLIIGGKEPGQGNVISGNTRSQISLTEFVDNVQVYGNKIGTNVQGTGRLDIAQQHGIYVDAFEGGVSNVDIGGTELGMSNIIAFNDTAIYLGGRPNAQVNQIKISQNRIFCNLFNATVLGDLSSNAGIIAPVITSANTSIIEGTAPPLSNVEVFLNVEETCLSSIAQGKIFLGNTEANENGDWALFGKFIIDPNFPSSNCATATATDSSGNTSEFSACANVELVEPPRDSLDVPNAFSPNEDGINDRWRISNLQSLFPNNEIQIFNRWGNQVYTARPFPGNGWDGRTVQGKPLDIGTYFFILRLNDLNREEEVVKGSITILK